MTFKYLKVLTYLSVLYGIADCTTETNPCLIAIKCVADLTCPAHQVLVQNALIYNCCPQCRAPEPDTDDPQVIQPPSVCSPPSVCLPDGRFAAVQCSGDSFNGRCFCTNEKGARIFGQMWRSEASRMTCACSRRRSELEASENRIVTLHCTPTGDYEPLQCDDGMCWCARAQSGQPTAGPVPEADMRHLPCYSSLTMGGGYLRKCESIVHALSLIHREQSQHGTSFLGNPTTFCDYDGSFGPFQINSGGIAHCTDRYGENMGSWQVMANDRAGMNCNCARDTNIYFPARGKAQTQRCQANGNYMPNQNAGDAFYCVDTNGYPTTEMLTEWPTDECRSFA